MLSAPTGARLLVCDQLLCEVKLYLCNECRNHAKSEIDRLAQPSEAVLSAGSVFLLHIMAALHLLSYLTPLYTGPGKRPLLEAGALLLAVSQHMLSSASAPQGALVSGRPQWRSLHGRLPKGLS